MRIAGIRDEILPWRDVLHDGPVPGGATLAQLADIRAQFIADCGWADYGTVLADFNARDAKLAAFRDYDEVLLWFEHDLYDQLQLVQLLDWFSWQRLGDTRLSLIQADYYLGMMEPARLAALIPRQCAVTPVQFQLARRAWAAFTAPEPSAMRALFKHKTDALPFLRASILRLLEEYPETVDGLSRTERGILCVVASGVVSPPRIFQAWQAYEPARFMGDSSFWQRMQFLTNAPVPALRVRAGTAFQLPQHGRADTEFAAQQLELTDVGHALLARQLDWATLNGVDKWIGGARVSADNLWRWSALRQDIARA